MQAVLCWFIFDGVKCCQLAAVVRPRLFTQSTSVSWEVLPLNRCPSSQVASAARVCRFVALEPIELLPEVQNSTMVLPVKS